MTIHECTRCGYKTKQAFDFKKHLQRKKLCDPTVADVSLDDLKKKYLSPRETLIDCPNCNKGFSSSYGYKLHIEKCNATAVTVMNDPSMPSTSASGAASTSIVSENASGELLSVIPYENIDITTLSSIKDSPLHLIVNGTGVDEGFKIRKTGEKPPRVSVYDLIVAVTGAVNPWADFSRISTNHSEVLARCYDFKFPGQGQRPTPVTDARGAVTIINLLPGSKAAAFRAKSADIMVRYLGGDETLIAEIKRNAELQANMPPENPMAIFGQDFVAKKEKSLMNLNNLKMPMNTKIISIGIPDALRSPCCVYVIFVGVEPESGKFVFKFGLTNDLARRISEHMKTYSCCVVVAVVSLGMYSPQCAEDTIKWLLPVQQKITVVKIASNKDDKTGTVNQETFACEEENVDDVIRGICKEVARIHAGKVSSVHYGHSVTDAAGTVLDPMTLKPAQMLPPSESEALLEVKQPPENWAVASLEVEKERTRQRQLELDAINKQKELEHKQKELELEKARIEAETKTKRFEMLMTMLDKHPDMSQHIDKLIALL